MIDHKLWGKCFFLWTLIDVYGADPVKIADSAQDAGLTSIWIKVHNGTANYNVSADIPAVVAELRKRNIGVYGWGYIYLANPVAEAYKAAERTLEFELDGYIADMEGECKGHPAEADLFCRTLISRLPDKPLGLSSYRFPSLHKTFPWEIRKYFDFDSPQVYPIGAHNFAEQLVASYNEYMAMSPVLPFIPTGAAWGSADWSVTPADALAFLQQAELLKLSAVSFWVFEKCIRDIPATWAAISGYVWREPDLPPSPPPAGDDLSEVLADLGLIKTALYNMGVVQQDMADGQTAIAEDVEEILAKVTNVTPPPPPPSPEPDGSVPYRVNSPDKIHAFQEDGKNGSGFPIMVSYPKGGSADKRIFYKPDQVVMVDPKVTRADSGTRWHELSKSEYPDTVTVDKLYLEKRLLIKVES